MISLLSFMAIIGVVDAVALRFGSDSRDLPGV
jgi:hypothetical protein